MDESQLAHQLKALAAPVRLRILELLPTHDMGALACSVSALAVALHVSQSTVSHHLGILKNAGLVKCRRECQEMHYWIDRQAVAMAEQALREVVEEK